MEQREPPNEAAAERHKLRIIEAVVVGLLGSCVVFVSQMLAAPRPLDEALQTAIVCFSAAIPLLTMAALQLHWKATFKTFIDFERQAGGWSLIFRVWAVGAWTAIIGIAAVFVHFSAIAGCVFVAVAVIAAVRVGFHWLGEKEMPTSPAGPQAANSENRGEPGPPPENNVRG
jgi:hypothetical protein